jgi:O-methyltransferase involved in polyketide biosynthesis
VGSVGINTSVPNVARIYDYILGGKDNFAADRQAAQQLLAAIPDLAGVVRDNRSFIGRVVRFLVGEAGIRQFLDLGAGLPTQDCVHEMAQAIAPDARVVYVDDDPVVCSHGQALLGQRDRVGFVLGDLRRPAEILRHPEVLAKLDFSQPVAVLCACVLHFVPDEENPHQLVAAYRDHLAPGSYLAITHGITAATPEDDPDGVVESVTNVYQNASAQMHVRPVKEIERFFDGLEIMEPGVVWLARWRPDPGIRPAGRQNSLFGGVGRKAGALAAGDWITASQPGEGRSWLPLPAAAGPGQPEAWPRTTSSSLTHPRRWLGAWMGACQVSMRGRAWSAPAVRSRPGRGHSSN